MSDEFFFLCATRDDENIISIIVYTVVNVFRVCLCVVCVPFGRCPGVPMVPMVDRPTDSSDV